MNHILRLKFTGPGNHYFANVDWTLYYCLLFDLGAPGALQGAGDTRSHPEMIIGSINQGIRFKEANITLSNFQLKHFDPPENA
jgi:hypothetical protein